MGGDQLIIIIIQLISQKRNKSSFPLHHPVI